MPLISFLVSLTVAALLASPQAQQRDLGRLRASANVLGAILGMTDGIPKGVLDRAVCVLVYPSVKRFSVGIQDTYARGAMTCRTGEAFGGPWSSPLMVKLRGKKVTLHLSGEAVDLVLLVMSNGIARSLLDNKIRLGMDAVVGFGPQSRELAGPAETAQAAQVLTYSLPPLPRIDLAGATASLDVAVNGNLYGPKVPPSQMVKEGTTSGPEAGRALTDILNQKSPQRAR